MGRRGQETSATSWILSHLRCLQMFWTRISLFNPHVIGYISCDFSEYLYNLQSPKIQGFSLIDTAPGHGHSVQIKSAVTCSGANPRYRVLRTACSVLSVPCTLYRLNPCKERGVSLKCSWPWLLALAGETNARDRIGREKTDGISLQERVIDLLC